MNPLLSLSSRPFQAIPFDQIKNTDFLPALKETLALAKEQIENLKNSSERVTFENSIEDLEMISDQVGQLGHIFFALHSAESDDTLRDVAKEFSPLLSEFSNDIILDPHLFSKVQQCYQDREKFNLNSEQLKLVEEWYQDFIRNGALLTEDKKQRLREIDQELAKLSLEFGDHLLKETNNNFLIIEKENRDLLKGLPEVFIEQAQNQAKSRGQEGKYVFTLDAPSYIPFMKYVDNREMRKKLFMLYSSRAFRKGENDNQKIVLDIVRLRHERAQLLGYKTHADFILEKRMANTPEKVHSFLQDLLLAARPFAIKDIEELKLFQQKLQTSSSNKEGSQEMRLERWDYSYYAEKLKKEKFDIDDEILRPYFKLESALQGIFLVANKLYSLQFTEITSVPVYHSEVKVFEVKDQAKNEHVGLLYVDLHPRKGKKSGAWMTVLKEQKNYKGENQRPHIMIVCNFTRPSNMGPSLLSFDEVGTLFHEFGHALHGLLSNCRYPHFAGTNVYWDFVELPSQIMENWLYEKDCLDLFASHYKTGENIPTKFIEKIKESSKFHEGYATLRQLCFALLDMAWHSVEPSSIQDVDAWERKNIHETSVLPIPEETNISCAFSHIFSGGYSAGYYSYKWAEVLDADAFEYFQEKGIFNPEVAGKFKEFILSKGGTEHPEVLYKKFRGRGPSIAALLKRAGLDR